MFLRRQRIIAVAIVALLAASGAACSAVLGLSPPTLDPCADGCSDGNPPTTDANPITDDVSTHDVLAPPDTSVAVEAETSVESPDAEPDAPDDQSAPPGIRCGPSDNGLYCTPNPAVCCLSLAEDGGPLYACVADESACPSSSAYVIECASNNDCGGNDVCCFFGSGLKCDSDMTCNGSPLVCDPSESSNDNPCSSSQKCTPGDVTHDGLTLPYDICK